MWAAIRTATGGRVEAQCFPRNNRIAGSDPGALKMLLAGEIHFFTYGRHPRHGPRSLKCSRLRSLVRSAAHAHQAGTAPRRYVREEMAARAFTVFAVAPSTTGCGNSGTKRPIVVPANMAGIRMRVPPGEMVADTFKAFGAEPTTITAPGSTTR